MFDNDYELDEVNDVFIVQEYGEMDLEKLLNSLGKGTFLYDEHILTTLYNSLCALNFIHTANVMHRDVKPSNIIINRNC
jgi:serine/threonine protein kinase